MEDRTMMTMTRRSLLGALTLGAVASVTGCRAAKRLGHAAEHDGTRDVLLAIGQASGNVHPRPAPTVAPDFGKTRPTAVQVPAAAPVALTDEDVSTLLQEFDQNVRSACMRRGRRMTR
jgi:hypothetical protein